MASKTHSYGLRVRASSSNGSKSETSSSRPPESVPVPPPATAATEKSSMKVTNGEGYSYSSRPCKESEAAFLRNNWLVQDRIDQNGSPKICKPCSYVVIKDQEIESILADVDVLEKNHTPEEGFFSVLLFLENAIEWCVSSIPMLFLQIKCLGNFGDPWLSSNTIN